MIREQAQEAKASGTVRTASQASAELGNIQAQVRELRSHFEETQRALLASRDSVEAQAVALPKTQSVNATEIAALRAQIAGLTDAFQSSQKLLHDTIEQLKNSLVEKDRELRELKRTKPDPALAVLQGMERQRAQNEMRATSPVMTLRVGAHILEELSRSRTENTKNKEELVSAILKATRELSSELCDEHDDLSGKLREQNQNLLAILMLVGGKSAGPFP